jgi:leukotriene-A4 hydrolase
MGAGYPAGAVDERFVRYEPHPGGPMRTDPHSVTDLTEGRTTDVHLDWEIDLQARRIQGEATLRFETAQAGTLHLDTRGLEVLEVYDDRGPIPWSWGTDDAVLGTPLVIERPTPSQTVRVRYRTGANATALMWLSAAQTTGAPFVLTQCQCIHARSIAPLQDSPAARIRYTADVTVPQGLSAVMSSAPPVTLPSGRLHFEMPQPIPPYLLALAVGDLVSRDLGPRTRVYAEPAVIEAAAWEFAQVEDMLAAAEGLFGPYPWERYDFVVLPPSFPMGGMENPRMTFLTPTLIAGDRSLVNVLAHELAHSWTGNLVTNANNEHFWLNEGWTVYAERRIIEALEGPQAAAQAATLARGRLESVIAERHQAGRSTALVYPQTGLDPDDEFSLIPYEKGFLLLTAIERAVGRHRFDPFIRAYIDQFAFSTLTTDDFVAVLTRHLPDHGVDLDAWIRGDGLPDDAPHFPSPRLDELLRNGLDARPTGVAECLYLLARRPPQDRAQAMAYAEAMGLLQTTNAELRSAWLVAATGAGIDVREAAEAFLSEVGRTKLVLPVVRAMAQHNQVDWCRRVVATQADRLHISTRRALDAVMQETL